MAWTGGRVNTLLNFELYRNGKFVAAPYTNIAGSVGKVQMTIPTSVKVGRNYRFKVSDSKNKDEVVFTEKFRVKARFPAVVKIGIVALLGGTLYALTSPQTKAEPDIVDPISPSK